MQISPQSRGCASNPIGQSATIAAGWRIARTRASITPKCGSQSRSSSCASRTTRPRRKRCWPMPLPTGPENWPVCRCDTRTSPSNSGDHGGVSASMRSFSVPSETSYPAAVAWRELQCGV